MGLFGMLDRGAPAYYAALQQIIAEQDLDYYEENLTRFLAVATRMATAFVGAVLLLGLALFLLQ